MELGFAFFFNSILLGIGLAMDAFSVSLANGLHEPHMSRRKLCGVAGVFAFFQALMPMAGAGSSKTDGSETGSSGMEISWGKRVSITSVVGRGSSSLSGVETDAAGTSAAG
ncbi:MAG: hypothetical protein IJE22_04235 [Oscillibacter sp.]|nr:hypothetical protein [Oscillibacter sp.]